MISEISKHGYPVFRMPRGLEFWSPAQWSKMICRIPGHYLLRTGRLPDPPERRRVRAIDSAIFSGKDDEVVLSLVELERLVHDATSGHSLNIGALRRLRPGTSRR